MERRQAKNRRRLAGTIAGLILLIVLTGCAPWVALPASGQQLPQASPTYTPTIPPTSTSTPLPSPTLTATPEPGCTATTGAMESLSIPSKAIGKPLELIVYTPPCYDPRSETGYPVLYMFHGQSFKQDQWVRLGMTTTADTLITAGELPPFLIIMPYELYNLDNPFAKGFDKAIPDELIHWVDANYHTCTQPACRVIAGLSRGGSWALYLGMAHMDLFGAIGAHSTAPFFGMGGYLSHYMREFGKENVPRLYIDFGENDSLLPYMTDFKKVLDGYKLPYEYVLRAGNHTEEYWSSHVEEYLRWYWKDWQPPL